VGRGNQQELSLSPELWVDSTLPALKQQRRPLFLCDNPTDPRVSVDHAELKTAPTRAHKAHCLPQRPCLARAPGASASRLTPLFYRRPVCAPHREKARLARGCKRSRPPRDQWIDVSPINKGCDLQKRRNLVKIDEDRHALNYFRATDSCTDRGERPL